MPDDKNILKEFEKLKGNEHFGVPAGYFDSLPDKIMSKINAAEEEPARISLWRTIKPQLALAASFVALFMLAYTGFKIFMPEKSTNVLPESEVLATLENEIYDIDESLIFELLETGSSEPIIDEGDLTDEEIMNYLTNEGSDIDLNLTEL